MATVKELITRFGFEIDDKGFHQLEDGISALKDGLLGLGAIAGGTAISLYELVKHTADSKDELYKMSQRVGINIENLRQLNFMAKLVGMSTDDLGLSLNLLNRNLANAKQGSPELSKAFRQIGISGDMLRSGAMNAENSLAIIATRFATLPDGPKKVQLAMEIFGRSGARMIPMLNSLHEGLTPLQREVMMMGHATVESGKMGEDFNMSLATMNYALGNAGRTIGSQLMPAVKDVIDQITRWLIQNKELVKTNLTGFVNALVAALKLSVRFIDVMIKSLSGMASSLGGVEIATKLLLGAMTILSGVSVLIGIGKLAEAVVSLGNSFAIASLKAVAIPALIGAAFLAIFLIVEDISSFFQGKDSFFGDLLNILPELGAAFSAVFGPIFEPFVAFMTHLIDGTMTWKQAFTDVAAIILNLILAPLRLVEATVGGIAGALGRWTGIQFLQDVGAGAMGMAKAHKFDSSSDIGAETAVGSSASGGRQTNNNLQTKMEFNFPPGTDPARVGDKIAESVSSGIDDILLRANQTASTGGAH